LKLVTTRRSLVVLIALIFGLLGTTTSQAGFFGPSADTKKNVALIKKLAPTETQLLNRYAAVTGANYKNDYITGQALLALLPDINAYISKWDALTATDSKLQAGIDLYTQSWNKYAEGITIFIDALNYQSYSKLAQGNSDLATARGLMKKAAAVLAPYLK